MDHLEILEVLPSCVWISSSMCLHLCCLNFLQLLLVLSHGPNHCFTSSSPPSIPRCPIAASSSWIFSFNFQNRTCTKTLLHCEVHEFSFSTSPHSPKIDSEQESYVHFIPALQSVPTNFRTRNVQCSCHISLYGSSNSLILNALEWEFDGASEYQLFASCTALNMFSNWWKQLRPSRVSTMLTILIEILLVLNSWERFFMPTKHFKHTLPPGWWSGVETNANKSTIPKISICGKVSLAKLVSVRVP